MSPGLTAPTPWPVAAHRTQSRQSTAVQPSQRVATQRRPRVSSGPWRRLPSQPRPPCARRPCARSQACGRPAAHCCPAVRICPLLSDLGRSREDEVALLEREDGRDVRDERGQREDLIVGVALLTEGAVDLEPQLDVLRMRNGRQGNDRRNRTEGVVAAAAGQRSTAQRAPQSASAPVGRGRETSGTTAASVVIRWARLPLRLSCG